MFNTFDIERSLLVLLISSDHQADIFRKVNSGLFTNSSCRVVYEKLKTEFNRTGTLDSLIASKVLNAHEFSLAIVDSEKFPSENNLNIYIQTLQAEGVRSKLLRIAEELKENKPCLEVIRRMKSLAEESLVETSAKSLVDISLEVFKYVKNYDASLLVKSGFGSMDEIIDGFYPGEVYVFGARTNVGKTNFAVNLSVNISRAKKRVLLFSSEMGGLKVVKDRFFPITSHSAANNFRKIASFKNKYEELHKVVGGNVALDIYICDKRRPDLSDIESLTIKHKPNVVIVDHLHRCRLPSAESLRHSMREFMIGVKDIATDRSIPIVLMAQVSRDVEKDKNRPPMLSDLSESKSIEEEADVVGMLWRGEENINEKIVEGYIAKNRNGETLAFALSTSTFDLKMTEYFKQIKKEQEPKPLYM